MGKIDISVVPYNQWGNCVKLTNGIIEILATIELGPRLIRFGFVEKENIFFEDINNEMTLNGEKFQVFGGGEWKIYGGHRLWLSPEEAPRSYYPDNEKVDWFEVENGIVLQPKKENWNQIQKQIEVYMHPDKAEVKVVHKIQNIGPWSIKFAPWAMSVMSQGGIEIVPQPKRDTQLLGNRILALWPYSDMSDERVVWGKDFISLKQDPHIDQAFKFGINNEEGWAAYFNFNQLFIKYYEHKINGNYPDFGVSYETFTNKHFLEMETIGELKLTEPGKWVEHSEKWILLDNIPSPSDDEAEIANCLAPYIKDLK